MYFISVINVGLHCTHNGSGFVINLMEYKEAELHSEATYSICAVPGKSAHVVSL